MLSNSYLFKKITNYIFIFVPNQAVLQIFYMHQLDFSYGYFLYEKRRRKSTALMEMWKVHVKHPTGWSFSMLNRERQNTRLDADMSVRGTIFTHNVKAAKTSWVFKTSGKSQRRADPPRPRSPSCRHEPVCRFLHQVAPGTTWTNYKLHMNRTEQGEVTDIKCLDAPPPLSGGSVGRRGHAALTTACSRLLHTDVFQIISQPPSQPLYPS